jgi:hypothetical protein
MIARERSFWMLAVLVLGIIILYLQQCKGRSTAVEIREVVKRDTVYQTSHDTTIWRVPVVRSVIRTDTFRQYFPVREFIDTAYLLHDYMLTRYYEDTTRIQYGEIITRDSVRENRIVAHQVEHRLNIPTIRETVTVIQPPRTQIYLGLGMISGRSDIIHGFEGTLSLKNKADQIYSLGGIIEPGGAMYWKGSVMFKIALKRRNR